MISCIVIGAGPGGIVTTKELLEKGFEDVLCLEKAAGFGGVFANTYDNLLLTSSVTFSMFSDFWVGEDKNHHFWTKDEALNYWESYAKAFNVIDHVQFDSEVVSVTEIDNKGWQVVLNSGQHFKCKRIVLAIGNNNVPKFPDWHNQITAVPYLHSKDYKNAQDFKDKRVLVVGGGESGSDVAYEISQVSEKCWVSLRESTGWIVPRKRGDHAADVSTHRGIWDLPREYGTYLSPLVLKLERGRNDPVFDALADLNEMVTSKNGIWGIFGTKTLALPKAIAYHGCKVVGEIIDIEKGGTTLKTADGSLLENVDIIVFSTGYKNYIDFMPKELQSCDPRGMYKHMFHPEWEDKIAWVGWARPGFGSQFPIMEMQARYCSLVFNNDLKLPSAEKIMNIVKNDMTIYKNQFEENAERIRSLIDYHRYMDSLANIIGCRPPLFTYFFRFPRRWIHLMYGPTQATQFRLQGPGKKIKLAHQIIDKLPISSYNHIVKAGLRGRVKYAFRPLLDLIKRKD